MRPMSEIFPCFSAYLHCNQCREIYRLKRLLGKLVPEKARREHTTHIPSMEFREKLWQYFFPKSLLGLVNNYKANFHRWILKLLILFCFPILYKLRHLHLNCLNFTGKTLKKLQHTEIQSQLVWFSQTDSHPLFDLTYWFVVKVEITAVLLLSIYQY